MYILCYVTSSSWLPLTRNTVYATVRKLYYIYWRFFPSSKFVLRELLTNCKNGQNHRRSIESEDKAKVVVSVWGTESLLAVLLNVRVKSHTNKERAIIWMFVECSAENLPVDPPPSPRHIILLHIPPPKPTPPTPSCTRTLYSICLLHLILCLLPLHVSHLLLS